MQLSINELKPAVSAGIRPGPCHRAPCAAVRGGTADQERRGSGAGAGAAAEAGRRPSPCPPCWLPSPVTAATKPSQFSEQRPVPDRHDRRLHHRRSARRTPARRHSQSGANPHSRPAAAHIRRQTLAPLATAHGRVPASAQARVLAIRPSQWDPVTLTFPTSTGLSADAPRAEARNHHP
jgi:hypothetical protein